MLGSGPWPFKRPGDFPFFHSCAPAVNDPLTPFVYAFQAKDGTLLWKAPIPDSTKFPLAVVDEVIYLQTHCGCSALRASNGAAIWEQEIRGYPCSPPVVRNGGVYLSYAEPTHGRRFIESSEPRQGQEAFLCALDASNGSLRWEHQLGIAPGAGLPTSPHVTPDAIYLGAPEGALGAFAAGDGVPRWHYQTGGTLVSAPIEASGAVFVGANDGWVSALRASDGALLWQTYVGLP